MMGEKIILPIGTHFHTPDKNGRIFDRSSFIRQINDITYHRIGGITVSFPPEDIPSDKVGMINAEDVVGIAKVNTDDMTAELTLNSSEAAERLSKMLHEDHATFELGIRALCLRNGDKYELVRLVCLDALNTGSAK